jgi:hypothetical protein
MRSQRDNLHKRVLFGFVKNIIVPHIYNAQRKAHAPTQICALSFLSTPASQFSNRFVILRGGAKLKDR